MSEQRDASALRVARANLGYGGMSVTGDATWLGKTLDSLRVWGPDIILVQEMTARAGLLPGRGRADEVRAPDRKGAGRPCFAGTGDPAG